MRSRELDEIFAFPVMEDIEMTREPFCMSQFYVYGSRKSCYKNHNRGSFPTKQTNRLREKALFKYFTLSKLKSSAANRRQFQQ